MAEGNQFLMCSCRLRRNFFVASVGRHFEFEGDDEEFLKRNKAIFDGRKLSEEEARAVLEEVKKQRQERMKQPEVTLARAERIAREYKPLHPDIYTMDRQRFLAPDFEEVVAAFRACGTRPAAVRACAEKLRERGLLRELRANLWSFRVLTAEFCQLLEEELAHFRGSGLPCAAPNTMNKQGIILGELGFKEHLFDPLVASLNEIGPKLFPVRAEELDSYRVFTVLYDFDCDGDRELSQHYDNAEVTLNINIGGRWEGGQVKFFGDADAREDPALLKSVGLELGHGVLHAGLDLHQAEPITAGRRHNLIFWCRSSAVRNDRCPMCFDEPQVVPTNRHMNEGFTSPPCASSTLGA